MLGPNGIPGCPVCVCAIAAIPPHILARLLRCPMGRPIWRLFDGQLEHTPPRRSGRKKQCSSTLPTPRCVCCTEWPSNRSGQPPVENARIRVHEANHLAPQKKHDVTQHLSGQAIVAFDDDQPSQVGAQQQKLVWTSQGNSDKNISCSFSSQRFFVNKLFESHGSETIWRRRL